MNAYMIKTVYGKDETPYRLTVRLDTVGQRSLKQMYKNRTGAVKEADDIIFDALMDNDVLVDVIAAGMKHRYNKNPSHLNPVDVVDGISLPEGIITRCQIVTGIAVCSGLMSPAVADAICAAAVRQEQARADVFNNQ